MLQEKFDILSITALGQRSDGYNRNIRVSFKRFYKRKLYSNRTRLCTPAHFARNEIKYQKSRESGLFQYILYACTIAGLFVIYTAL